MVNDSRTAGQLKKHYEIEKELANKLRNANRQERRFLYNSVYEELYRLVPHHPQLTRKLCPSLTAAVISKQMEFLKRFLLRGTTFLEIGPGDCTLSFEVSKWVDQVFAIDVTDELIQGLARPDNFQLILSDGCSIPVQKNSIDVAYSNQLMEHLHPEDAYEQLSNIYNSLVLGGIYICLTPNRLSGPHDVSSHFDTVATGFHLREYSITELSSLFRTVGFSKIKVFIGTGGKYLGIHPFPLLMFEKLLEALPYAFRVFAARNQPFRQCLGIRLVGTK